MEKRFAKSKDLKIYTIGIVILLFLGSCTKTDPDVTPAGSNNSNGSTGNTVKPTVTTPNTFFIASQDYTTSGIGSYWTQQFTVNQTTSVVFRFTSQYQAQAAIITPDQLNKFQSNQSFTGYGLFDKTFGTNSVTLTPGTYYVAIRNSISGANKWSTELDYTISLPASDKATFYDNYVTGVKAFTSAGKFWQPFTIQSGFRYFLDGCNVNCDFKIIPASSLAAYQNGQTYTYYTDYVDSSGAAPGLWEITLNPGDYYLVSTNTTVAALTYVMERWRVN